MSLPTVLAEVRCRPGMYQSPATLETMIAFVNGYDLALSGGLLVGFREWLVMRAGEGTNLAWMGLVRAIVESPAAVEDDEAKIEAMFVLIEQFLAARDTHDGLRKIFAAYERWLEARARGM